MRARTYVDTNLDRGKESNENSSNENQALQGADEPVGISLTRRRDEGANGFDDHSGESSGWDPVESY